MFDKRKDNTDKNEQPQPSASTTERPAAPAPMAPRSTAIIGETIKIKGDITGDENLAIEGQVEGFVKLKQHDITVGQNGNVTADLEAKNVKVHGTVTGNIRAADVAVVSKSGNVKGNITAPRVTLEDGAKFKGSIDMDPQTSAAPPKAAEAKKPADAQDLDQGAA